MANQKAISLKQWKEMTGNNSENSYSLAVQLAILLIWENKPNDPDATRQLLTRNIGGLTGAQANCAIKFAKQYKPDWIK